jgi:hypothetical protein
MGRATSRQWQCAELCVSRSDHARLTLRGQCCPVHLEDPVQYVLQCPGLADIWHQFRAVDDAASNLEYGVAPHTAMKLLFNRGNFADLAGYLSRAYKRRFSANNGVEAMKAVAAGRTRWMMGLPCRRSLMRRRIVDLALLCSSGVCWLACRFFVFLPVAPVGCCVSSLAPFGSCRTPVAGLLCAPCRVVLVSVTVTVMPRDLPLARLPEPGSGAACLAQHQQVAIML